MEPGDVLIIAHGLMVDRYANTAAAATWFYDYLLTLFAEREHIWKKEWSLVKVLYLLNRYLTPPFLIVVIYHLDGEQRGSLSFELYACVFYDIFATVIRWIQLVTSTWIILIVVQSLSLNNPWIKRCLYTIFIAMNVAVVVFAYITLREMYPTITYTELFHVCYSSAPNAARWLYMCQVPFDFLLLFIELFYYWRFHRLVAPAEPTKLLTALYLDGVWYFVATITVKLSAGLVIIFADPCYWYIVTSADQAFTSTFISRLVLHLRSISSESSSGSCPPNTSSGIATGTDIGTTTHAVSELRRRDADGDDQHTKGDDEDLNETYDENEGEEWRLRDDDAIEMGIPKKMAPSASRQR